MAKMYSGLKQFLHCYYCHDIPPMVFSSACSGHPFKKRTIGRTVAGVCIPLKKGFFRLESLTQKIFFLQGLCYDKYIEIKRKRCASQVK
jgi:hypothetical protein